MSWAGVRGKSSGAPPADSSGKAYGKGFSADFSFNGGAPPMFGNTMPGDMMAEMPPVSVFLAPATMNITPVSSKPGNNKQIAMQFIQSSREVQQQMLRE